MFYLTTHSTHFIYGYMASDIWLRTILIVRKETRCRHIGYSFRLTARVLLYAPSHRQKWYLYVFLFYLGLVESRVINSRNSEEDINTYLLKMALGAFVINGYIGVRHYKVIGSNSLGSPTWLYLDQTRVLHKRSPLDYIVSEHYFKGFVCTMGVKVGMLDGQLNAFSIFNKYTVNVVHFIEIILNGHNFWVRK